MRAFIAVNEVLRFVFELVALAAFGWAAASLADGAVRIVLAAIAVVVGAAVWGALVAPKATRRLADPARLGLEVVFFALAGACLVRVGHPIIGIGFAALAIANAVLLRRHEGVLGAIS